MISLNGFSVMKIKKVSTSKSNSSFVNWADICVALLNQDIKHANQSHDFVYVEEISTLRNLYVTRFVLLLTQQTEKNQIYGSILLYSLQIKN